jgi:hypothetical protein
MRGTKVKQLRRQELAAVRKRVNPNVVDLEFVFGKGGAGKSFIMGKMVNEVRKPRGTWKEYWQKKIRNVSAKNRLPRGFKEPKAFDFDASDIDTTQGWVVSRKPLLPHQIASLEE